jgi:UDP-2,3-diacylglucosamine pyrophosphatase LpxH
MKTYVASDFHIGEDDYPDYERIRRLLQRIQYDGDKLILAGDTFDTWRSAFEQIVKYEPMWSTYNLLLDTASSIDTVLIYGNHDYNIGKKLKDTNIKVVDDFTEDGIFYTHGWKWDLTQWAAYPFFGEIVEKFPFLYQKYIYKPKYLKFGHPCEDPIHGIARDYADIKKVKVVMGHTHRAFTDGVVFDCGCYGRNYVVVEDGKVELKSI